MKEPSNYRLLFEGNPLYQKALSLMRLTERIAEMAQKEEVDTSSSEGEVAQSSFRDYARFICEDAMMIPAKIAGAVSADLYDIKMQNAAIIRKCAMDLILHLRGLQIHGFKEVEYLDLARKEIDDFRIAFAEWVKTFDTTDYIIDRWGLFNPPGVNYDDRDPDDDIPFDPRDYFGDFFEDPDDD